MDDQTVEVQLRLTADLVKTRERMGDRSSAPREVDHVAVFRSKTAARAAAQELESLGYRIAYRRRLLTVEVAAHHESPVDQPSAANFTRDVFGVIASHGGTYDGWGASLVK